MFEISLHTTFHLPSCNGSLVHAMERKTMHRFRAAVMITMIIYLL